MTDQQIRTLDYGDSDPFESLIGRARALVWPVHVYRVTIPSPTNPGEMGMNPFDKVILSLLDVLGGVSVERLAEESRIPVDLVRSVVLKLQDRNLIDRQNVLIDEGRRRWALEQDELSYATALVFRELVGGRLLPFAHVVDARSPVKTKLVKPPVRYMTARYEAEHLGPPSAGDVLAVITRMNRRSMSNLRSARSPSAGQIRVAFDPERYLLHCPIGIQQHDADFRIADPLEGRYSHILEEEFTKQLGIDANLQDWMRQWRETLTAARSIEPKLRRLTERFATAQNLAVFPDLVANLTPSEGTQFRSVGKIFASLEWALYYCCEMHDPDTAIRRVELEQEKYPEWLAGVAAGIGFEQTRSPFRRPPRGKLDDYRAKKPEMETVLALGLAQAEVNPSHPLRRVAALDPNFIERLRDLAKERGHREHGNRSELMLETEAVSDVWMRSIVSALLPTVQFDEGQSPVDPSPTPMLRLRARHSLIEVLGWDRFSRFGPNAQAALLAAERFCIEAQDHDDALEFVGRLYAALNSTLALLVRALPPLGVFEGDYKAEAGKKSEAVGLGTLPGSLATVNKDRISEALKGNDAAVGPLVIALLLTLDEEMLQEVKASQPEFLEDIHHLLVARGHANKPIRLPKAEVLRYRRRALATLVTLQHITPKD